MIAQWDCFLKNLGIWEGSFTNFSITGKEVKNIPSRLEMRGINNNEKVSFNLTRFPENEAKNELNLEFSSLNKSILFLPNGAFSQGSIQWAPFSTFGGELGLIDKDRRLRLVQMYNKESLLETITLIREKSPHSLTPERPVLTVDQLLGEWEGQVTTIYPDLRGVDTYKSHLQITQESDNYLSQKLTFGDRLITSTARLDGSILKLENSRLPVQILMLPDGASCNCPLMIKPRTPFVLELGWLLNPNQRLRLIRSYSDKGEWTSLTLVEETRVC
jgi:Domain of unknown function (DUF3598)